MLIKVLKLDCCKSNSREVITLFYYTNKNKVAYLHRQATSNVRFKIIQI